MGTGKMKKMSRQQQKAVGASMNEAAGKMLSPLGFGTAGLFGSMGGNQMINSLTNANAMAAQQAAAQQAAARAQNTMGGGGMNDYSQPIMTGSLDPMTQQIGLGMFGSANARQRALAGSGLMMDVTGEKNEFTLEELNKRSKEQDSISKKQALKLPQKEGLGNPDYEMEEEQRFAGDDGYEYPKKTK